MEEKRQIFHTLVRNKKTGKEEVVNPETGKYISVGGKIYENLVTIYGEPPRLPQGAPSRAKKSQPKETSPSIPQKQPDCASCHRATDEPPGWIASLPGAPITDEEMERINYLIDWKIDPTETEGEKEVEAIIARYREGAISRYREGGAGETLPSDTERLASFLSKAIYDLRKTFPFEATEIVKLIFSLGERFDLGADFWSEAADAVFDPTGINRPYSAYYRDIALSKLDDAKTPYQIFHGI